MVDVNGAIRSKPPRNEEVERLRGMAILGVVVLHSLSLIAYDLPGTPLSATSLFVIMLSGFAVPFFFIIAGYVLYLRHPHWDRPLALIRTRLLSVLPAYLVVSVIYSLYNGETSLSDILVSILTFSASGHLWFVAAIISFYVLYPAIVWLTDRVLGGRYLALVVISAIIQLAYYFIIRDHLPGLLAGLSSFLGYILYFCAGIYLAGRQTPRAEAFSPSVIGACFSASIVLSIALTFLYYQLGDVDLWSKAREAINPIIVALMLLALYDVALRSSRSRWGARMKGLGADAYGIYLIHALFISIISEYVLSQFLELDDPLFFILLIPAVLLSSYLVIEAIGRIPAINKVLRVRRG